MLIIPSSEGSEYSRETKQTPVLQMPWLLPSPGHQQTYFCNKGSHLSSMRTNFSVKIWYQKLPHICVSFKTTCLFSFRKSFACARASKLTTNMYIARARCESQPAVEFKGAECSLMIATGYWVQVFSLILDISVSLSAGIQSAGDLVPEILGLNPAFSRGRQLVSFRFENRLPVPEHQKWQQICIF